MSSRSNQLSQLPYSVALQTGAHADRLDLRDRSFVPEVRHLPQQFPDAACVSQRWPDYLANYVMNQGSDGACTGFGLAAVIHYLNWLRGQPVSLRSARMLYHLAQFYDEWPGEDYTGSSCRGALKGWHKHGVCAANLWPYTVKANGKVPAFEAPQPGWANDALSCMLGVYYRVDQDDITAMQAAIAQSGALYVSSAVHAGWDHPKKPGAGRSPAVLSLQDLPVIQPHAQNQGMHAFALIGYTTQGFVVQNSWGSDWGRQGLAILPYEDWLQHGSDAWTFALGVPVSTSSTQHGKLPVAYRHNSKHHQPQLSQTQQNAGLSLDQAYSMSLILDSSARVIQRLLPFADAAATVDYIAHQAPLTWHTHTKQRGPLRLAVIAQSGLCDEAQQIQENAVSATAWLAQGIYPVFMSWNSGLTGLEQQLRAEFAQQNRSAALNRSIEAQADALGWKARWTQMKHRAWLAAQADQPPRALHVLLRVLSQLQRDCDEQGIRLDMHLIGDRAGALLTGQMIASGNDLHFASVQLLAPACSLDFALSYFGPALHKQTLHPQQLKIYCIAEQALQQTHFADVYQGGLLYLIANALEDRYQTPLLGLASALDAGAAQQAHWHPACRKDLQRWHQLFWQGAPPQDFARHGDGLTARQRKQLRLIAPEALSSTAAGQAHPARDALLQELISTIKATKRER
ncbi:C1 family peptidase [Undibacterium rugosum]|uniref:C1 family peptidase n=1 Tax=Undibacterium rugosum TaxID=2762291 RepID=UPI001B84248B|nr:C1 family peptidase [Undibacterium rugosum]MBR7779902.1 C1 family peptidase [Undibacterium rugosum]